MPLRMYFDPNAQYVITDNWGPTEGQPDAYEGPGAGGEVIANGTSTTLNTQPRPMLASRLRPIRTTP